MNDVSVIDIREDFEFDALERRMAKQAIREDRKNFSHHDEGENKLDLSKFFTSEPKAIKVFNVKEGGINGPIVTLNIGGVFVTGKLDSGADINVLPEAIVSIIKNRGISFQIREIQADDPLAEVQLADGTISRCEYEILFYEMTIYRDGEPVNIKNVTFAVFKGDLDSGALIGEPLLRAMGIDVEEMFKKSTFQELDCKGYPLLYSKNNEKKFIRVTEVTSTSSFHIGKNVVNVKSTCFGPVEERSRNAVVSA